MTQVVEKRWTDNDQLGGESVMVDWTDKVALASKSALFSFFLFFFFPFF